jgi:hypothetical protein
MAPRFAAVHVRGAPLGLVAEQVRERLRAEGFEVAPDDASADGGRSIAVYEEQGWAIVVEQEAPAEAEALAWAERLSRALHSDALTLRVEGERVLVALHCDGGLCGALRLPVDALPAEDGHRRAPAGFLAHLAVGPEAKAELERGVLADRVLIEETVHDLGRWIGLPHADRPPAALALLVPAERARQLHFTPRTPTAPPPRSGPTSIAVHAPARLEAFAGFPLEEHGLFQLAATGGEVRGVELVLSGEALRLLRIDAVTGWNPAVSEAEGETVIREARLASLPDGALHAGFEEARLGPPTGARAGGGAATGARAVAEGVAATFFAGLRGRGEVAGAGALVLRARSVAAPAIVSPAVAVEVIVRPTPRTPLLPPDRRPPEDTRALREWASDLAAYAGDAWGAGWLAFDAPFAAFEDAVLALTAGLAEALLDATAAGELHARLVSGGTRPRSSGRFRRGDRLAPPAWSAELGLLRGEAILELAAERGAVQIAAQPGGSTLLSPALRAQIAAIRPAQPPVPLAITWSIPTPPEARARARLAEAMARAIEAAAARPECVGGLCGASGAPGDALSLPYEKLAGLGAAASLTWVRHHARAPAWRVLVPPAAAAGLPAETPGVTRRPAPAGLLLGAQGADPFALSDADRGALERALLPAIGTTAEAQTLTGRRTPDRG